MDCRGLPEDSLQLIRRHTRDRGGIKSPTETVLEYIGAGKCLLRWDLLIDGKPNDQGVGVVTEQLIGLGAVV